MKTGALLFLLALLTFGCADGTSGAGDVPYVPAADDVPQPVFVDGPYYVTVENSFNEECTFILHPASGPSYTLDVVRRTDGKLNLVSGPMTVGPSVIEGVTLNRDLIRHQGTYKAQYSSKDRPDYSVLVQGKLSPESVDLLVTSTEGECVQTSHLFGAPRPLRDPAALDGRYALEMINVGSTCPSQPEKPSSSTVAANLTDNPASDTVWFDLGEGISVTVPRPGPDGRVDWTGDFTWIYANSDMWDMHGTVTGILLPGKVDLQIDYEFAAYPLDCPFRMLLKGRKQLPDPARVDNDYSVHIDVSDTCPNQKEGEESHWSLESTASLLTEPDGTVVLSDLTGKYYLMPEAGKFSVHEGNPKSFTIETVGTIAPPRLSYRQVATEYDADGKVRCQLEAVISGVARYVSAE